jgi:hypothetical protein
MAYSANYTASDISAVVIDNLVGIGAAIFAFASLVAVVLLYRFVRGKKGL